MKIAIIFAKVAEHTLVQNKSWGIHGEGVSDEEDLLGAAAQ